MKSAKQHGQRIAILTIVGVFLLSSFGISGLIVYDAVKGKNSNNETADLEKQLQEQLEQQSNPPKEGQLEGTKLEGFEPIAKVETLQIIDTVPGTGAEVPAGGTVTAHYTGAIAKDGTIFQSSKDSGQPFTSPLTGVIQGWQQGIPGMKEGGKRRLIIPAALAYGDQSPSPSIPPNSDLVFDIELIKVGE